MAAPGGTRLGRAVPLDSMSAAQISQIEVVKSVTPDLDANSLGGTVNIKTTSAFDRKGRFISGSGSVNYNESTEKTNIEGQLTFADMFGPNRTWGIAVERELRQARAIRTSGCRASWNHAHDQRQTVYLPNGLKSNPSKAQIERMGRR